MSKEQVRKLRAVVKNLAKLAMIQVKHHGHGCAYGGFPTKLKLNYCEYCTPTVKAVKQVRQLLRVLEG